MGEAGFPVLVDGYLYLSDVTTLYSSLPSQCNGAIIATIIVNITTITDSTSGAYVV